MTALNLSTHWQISYTEKKEIDEAAFYIYENLVKAGLDHKDAEFAVEHLYAMGFGQGYASATWDTEVGPTL